MNNILKDIIWSVIYKVAGLLIIESVPLQGVKHASDFAKILQAAYHGNYTYRAKLATLTEALLDIRTHVPAQWQSYLDNVIPWLQAISQHWFDMELAQDKFINTSSGYAKAQVMFELTERMLSSPALKSLLAAERRAELQQVVKGGRQVLGHIQLLQSMPGDARPEDYLSILINNPIASQLLSQQLLELGKALSNAGYPWPREGSLTEQISWIIKFFSGPNMLELMRPRLQTVLGESCELFFSTMKFISRLDSFPIDASPGRQALWVLRNSSDVSLPWLSWSGNMQGGPEMVTLLSRLFSSPVSGRTLMKELTAYLMPFIGQSTLCVLPAPVQKMLGVCWDEFNGQGSWSSIGWRVLKTTVTDMPYWWGNFLPGSDILRTYQYAEELSKKTDWQSTLKWFVSHDPSQSQMLQQCYQKGLTALLFWNIYQILGNNARDYQEDMLRQLSGQLKEFEVVRHYPQLKTLTDLLPLLPRLLEAQKTVQCQPTVSSWSEWMEQWLNALDGSNSRELTELRADLENWLAERLMSVCDSVVARQWEVLPGVSASPVMPGVPLGIQGNGRFITGSGMALLGAAFMAYAIYKWRRNLRERSIQTPSTQTLAQRDNNSALLYPQATRTPSHSQLSSGINVRLPAVLGMVGAVAMVAGVSMAYHSGASDAPISHELDDSQRSEILDFVRTLSLDYLDSVFDSPAIKTGHHGKPIKILEGLITIQEIQPLLDGIEEEARRDKLKLIVALFDRMKEKEKNITKFSVGKKSLYRLLFIVDGMKMVIKELESFSDSGKLLHERCLALYYRLWMMVNGLMDADSQSTVIAWNNSPKNKVRLSFASSGSVGDMQHHDADLMKKILDKIEGDKEIHSPIFHPALEVIQEIEKGIREYETTNHIKLGVGLDSKIKVSVVNERLEKKVNTPNNTRKIIVYVGDYSLFSLATMNHYRDSDKINASSVLLYERGVYDGSGGISQDAKKWNLEISSLIKSLNTKVSNMEKSMITKVNQYRQSPGERKYMVSLYRKQIALRCLQYLDARLPESNEATVVTQFLNDEIKVSEVYFKGHLVCGVFFLPTGSYTGLLFSISEEGWYVVNQATEDGRYINCSILPDSDEFRQWFFSKFPSRFSLEYIHQKRILASDRSAIGSFSGLSDLIVTHMDAVFKPVDDPSTLALNYFEGLMACLVSDIDALIWTYDEDLENRRMELIKQICFMGGAVATVAALFATPPIALLLLTTGLLMNAGTVAALSRQAGIADTEAQAARYVKEALFITAFTVLGVVTDFGPLAAKGVKSAMTEYQRIDRVSRASFFKSKPSGKSVKAVPEKQQGQKKLFALADEGGSGSKLSKEAKLGAQIVPGNIDKEALLNTFKTNKTIMDAIEMPAGKREVILNPVSVMAKDNGFTDIKYRGIFLWDSVDERSLANHFVVTAKKNGNEYVFDLTAHQFAKDGMPDLTKPLILPQEEWVRTYQKATTDKLITYGDYETVNLARWAYPEIPGTSGININILRPGEKILVLPSWYKKKFDLWDVGDVGVLGVDSSVTSLSNGAHVDVWVHGALGNTNHMPGPRAAAAIRDQVKIQNINFAPIQSVRLNSCYSAMGGRFSNAQIIANELHIKVTGYYGKVSKATAGVASKKTFTPMTNNLDRIFSEKINKALFNISESFMAIRRRLRGTRAVDNDGRLLDIAQRAPETDNDDEWLGWCINELLSAKEEGYMDLYTSLDKENIPPWFNIYLAPGELKVSAP